jgi:hypothetical protein
MSMMFVAADVPALERLAGLVDRAARDEPSARVLSEIRMLEDRFGLNPAARRRLLWEIEPTGDVVVHEKLDEEDESRWLRAVSD